MRSTVFIFEMHTDMIYHDQHNVMQDVMMTNLTKIN